MCNTWWVVVYWRLIYWLINNNLLDFFNDLKRSINLEIIKIRVLEKKINFLYYTYFYRNSIYTEHYLTGMYSPEMIHYNDNVGLRITIFAIYFLLKSRVRTLNCFIIQYSEVKTNRKSNYYLYKLIL